MKKAFSTSWVSSKQPRKQRKYRHNAPLHVLDKFMNAKLSKALSEKHNAKRARVRVGDKVKVMRGKFSGKEAKVELVNVKKSNVYLTGIEVLKKDGSKAKIPIHASNVMITDLNMDDKKRMDRQAAEAKAKPAKNKTQ
jgi:large subunit ribosomal protein L24